IGVANALLAALGLIALFAFGATAAARTTQGTMTVQETIDVTGRPIPEALDVIEKRYGVPIDYSDPVYASSMDTQLLYIIHGKRVPVPPLVPKLYTLHFEYLAEKGPPGTETVGPPVEGMTAMIQRLLDQFAAQGGPVFGVRKVMMPYGPRWEVYPVRARNALDVFVAQPDFLGATVHIPLAAEESGSPLDVIAEQLTQKWGRKFVVMMVQAPGSDSGGRPPMPVLSGENISARQALAELMGTWGAFRIFYVPGQDSFFINVGMVPRRPPPRPPVPPPPEPAHNGRVPPGVWIMRSRSPGGRLVIQVSLSRAGYLHTVPTTQWDADAVDATRRFQAANGLPATGQLDPETILKLEPFLPKLTPERRPYVPMSPALAYWLQSTRRGWRDVQTALTKAGFYSGDTTGSLDRKTHEALQAFQQANSLQVTGELNYKTAEKLAPLLPKAE
ncbi:MAG TPA: peptidoglycan-binding domain-containing protein, partial [Candidatus Dormibacteraeota bacterium]|nr:peptidoglycan-binding domain-containing protein [Candidatus Dormibacteraeota bacterium]